MFSIRAIRDGKIGRRPDRSGDASEELPRLAAMTNTIKIDSGNHNTGQISVMKRIGVVFSKDEVKNGRGRKGVGTEKKKRMRERGVRA